MHHLYLSYQPSNQALDAELRALKDWCVNMKVDEYSIIEEHLTNGRISQKQIVKLLAPIGGGDIVVASSLTRLGRGINMLISVMSILHDKGATFITIDDGRTYLPDQSTADLISGMELTANLVTRIKAERSLEAMHKVLSDGKTLGRPTGSKKDPKKNVLFGKESAIKQMRESGLSQMEIANALGVSRGTIFNYLKAHKPE